MKEKNRARSLRQVRRRQNKGVSPVIGVILMVAATIVIASVVMGMLGGFGPPTPTKAVAISTSRINATHVSLTLTSIEPSGTNISYINFSNADTGDTFGNDATWDNPTVGKVYVLNTSDGAGGASPPVHIIGVATFGDGSSQVVLDRRI
ncbi:MAG: type IV pilin [Candidatus Methanospirareceae archaeon]